MSADEHNTVSKSLNIQISSSKMASALEEREELSSKCFICNVKVTTRSSYNVYCTLMPQRKVLLIEVMSKILKKFLNPSKIRSSVLCRRCFTLFDELDQISTRFKKLQTDIIKRYTSTCVEYNDDHFLNNINNMTPTNIEELSFSEEENDSNYFHDDDENSENSSIALNEIVEGIISNIQAEETKDNDEECISENSRDKIVLIDEEVTEYIDEVNIPLSDVVVESMCETNNMSKNNDEECISENSRDKIVLIDEEVTEYIDEVNIPLSDVVVESMCETKLGKHSVGLDYECEHCDDSFPRASDLKNHFTMVHQTPKRFSCSSCDKTYSTKQYLNNHLIKEHKTLDKETINDQVDDSTSTVKTENENFQCNTDSNVVSEASADYINDAPEGLVINLKPEFSIDNSMYLEEVVQDENDDDFEWEEDKQFEYTEQNVLEDSSSAIDETIAPSSGSEKSGKKQLKKGRKKRGSSRSGERACLPAIHGCGICGKKWRTVTELKSHIQSHSSIRPYVCEICGQAYKMKKALDVHIGMHNGIHPFTCEYCNKSFTQKVGLQKHIPIHTGYTRFQCDLCGKRFIHQKSFHIHTMTHTGEKHVKCTECGLAVLSQSHLKRHLRVHTGERPYACPICGKRFAEKYNMNAHVHIHENNSTGAGPRRNRNHICQLCGMSYDRKHKLEYHLASAHNKIDSKLSQDQESVQMQQPKIEYFQENSQGQQIITMENNGHNSSTAMITVSGVKLPISLECAPIMVATMPQQTQSSNIVPISIPASSLLSYAPSNANANNDQQMADGSPNVYLPQNPVTIQLS